MAVSITTLISNKLTTGAGASFAPRAAKRTFQAVGSTSAGSGAAAVRVDASNDGGTTWIPVGTISLTLGTSATTDGFASDAPWALIRGYVVSISGTDASVSLYMGG